MIVETFFIYSIESIGFVKNESKQQLRLYFLWEQFRWIVAWKRSGIGPSYCVKLIGNISLEGSASPSHCSELGHEELSASCSTLECPRRGTHTPGQQSSLPHDASGAEGCMRMCVCQ